MDPITLLSAAAATSAVAGKSYELVNWIRELCQGIKTVDERVQRLKSGVSELARACESVHAVHQPDASSTTLTPLWDKDGSSATSISHQASNCRGTLKELKEILADLRPGQSSRISRHMKLQDRGKKIDGLSARISTHTNALQMSLQIATIKIALATPDFVIRELKEALRDIRKLLSGTQDTLISARGDDEDQLVGLAQDALRRGTTLYEASVAGSTVVMGSEKAVSVGKWMNETAGAAQDIHAAARSDRLRFTSGAGNSRTPITQPPVEDAIHKAPSASESSSDAGSSSCDDSKNKSLPSTEEKSASTTEPPDMRRLPADFSTPLNQWDRSDVLSRFKIRPVGRLEEIICTGAKVDLNELLRPKGSENLGKIDVGGHRQINTLALHFAVLFQDLHWVESLVNVGYSPNFSARIADKQPLRGLRTPIDIAIASHCEPITRVLLKRGRIDHHRLNHACLQLFATNSLDLWPPTDMDAYTGVLRLLVAHEYDSVPRPWRRDDPPSGKVPWTVSVLHQILDLPEPSVLLRGPLVTFALGEYRRGIERNYYFTNYQPLHVTIELHDVKTMRYLLETSSTRDWDSKLLTRNGIEWSLLRHAVEIVEARYCSSLEIVRELLEQGASLDVTSFTDARALFGGHLLQATSMRDIAMRSKDVGLRKLVAKY